MKTKRNNAFTLIELLVVITIIAILAGLAVPTYTYVQMLANQGRGVNNARQIIVSMKLFSKDHGSMYPDSVANPLTGSLAQNANDAFRYMIQEKIVPDERIFGCPAGYNPDGNIGQSPNYGHALTPGENHWAMTAGLTDTAAGNMPLVFENPATPSWPPLWNADMAGKIAPGRTWSGGKIIIGRNDGSVAVESLSGMKGLVGPQVMAGGSNLFTQASDGIPQRVLPVAYSNTAAPPRPFPPLASGAPPLGGPTGAPPAPGDIPSALPPSPLGR
ncbi:prepilin-type N-terminal cleavage/methylation domain-containing protein [Prosthecobacter sp.]|uniref:prepilin-type N-terminal cleavage/methylation domain-containing protein n=1 Tax=Prosthecobacter sp. TaxID=1965333 RepID=UPI001DDCAA7F|nr:prepilin-type N-terminal cleavage/methylation domain-containing protein [Prosthecobacter sp.]MCB1279770.1 prepilin-type N-terminal cleavage/methylation domain-containing protein [Prosthecobacter sp.]